jgi:hypothetical protein
VVSIGSLLHQGGIKKPVVASALDPGRGEGAARLAGDSLVDHLAVDCSDALGILDEDGAGLLHGALGVSAALIAPICAG